MKLISNLRSKNRISSLNWIYTWIFFAKNVMNLLSVWSQWRVLPSIKQMDDRVLIEAVLPPAFPLTPPAVNSHKLHLCFSVCLWKRERNKSWAKIIIFSHHRQGIVYHSQSYVFYSVSSTLQNLTNNTTTVKHILVNNFIFSSRSV